jgi:aspartyl protease family protein
MQIQAQALFKNTAVLMIDGRQRMLKAGKRSPEGVLLVTANPKLAVIEVNGQRQQLTLSKLITSNFTAVTKTELTIPRTSANQYITSASINGRRVSVLVDTGATSVAMSSLHAQRLGLDYKQGVPSRVITASGEAAAYQLTLNSLNVGGIEVGSVLASVVEGDYPVMILLGMSYLKHVNMREQNGTLLLQAKY